MNGYSSFVTYKPSGEVFSVGYCQTHMLNANKPDGMEIIEVTQQYQPGHFYVVAGVVTPLLTFAVTVAGNIISGIPIGTKVECEGNIFTVNDGSIELTFTIPGTYKAKLSLFPYETLVVNVVGV